MKTKTTVILGYGQILLGIKYIRNKETLEIKKGCLTIDRAYNAGKIGRVLQRGDVKMDDTNSIELEFNSTKSIDAIINRLELIKKAMRGE
jgi:MOSC domain-containing protein YiiM